MEINITFHTLNEKLKQLGWDWGHPRATAYILTLSKIKKYNFTPTNLPTWHYRKLYNLLDVYQRIDYLLKAGNGSWNDLEIVEFFQKYSVVLRGKPTNRLTYSNWLELEKYVKKTYLPF